MTISYFDGELYNSLPCGVVVFDKDFKLVNANKAYYEMFACGNEETLNIREKDKAVLSEIEGKLVSQTSVDVDFVTEVGKKHLLMQIERYGEGLFLGTLLDASGRFNLLKKLQKEKNIYARAIYTSDNIIFEHDIINDSALLYIPSSKNGEMDEYQISDYDEYMRNDGIAPDSVEFFFRLVYNEEEKMISSRMKLPGDADWIWYRMHRQFKHDDDGNLIGIYGIITNIEAEKRQENEYKRKIEMDSSLNVYNRNAAVDRINAYLEKNSDRKDFALLVMDIDDFKHINDTYGHLYGDTVIEMAANALNEVVGTSGIVGRYGGDEFFAFLRESTDEEIEKKASGILAAFEKMQFVNDEHISCSVGISLGSSYSDKVTYKDMFEKADKALYYVKNSGKAKWSIYDEENMSDISGYAIGYEVLDVNSKDMLESKDMMKVFLELSTGAKNSDNVIARIMRYITERFQFDRMRVMFVDCQNDMIAIKHDWCAELDYRSFSSKSGYYVHSDIMRFREYFEKEPVFEITMENAEGFSLKLAREFEKGVKNYSIYIANTTSDNYFYMFECTRFGRKRAWTKEECQELNVATKILTMYVSQADKETENEKKLKEMLDYERKTGLYSMGKFYEQLGKLRKIALERDQSVALVHTDFNNFLDFNMKFGQEMGDRVIVEFADFIKANQDTDSNIYAHIDGTDIFVSALRIENDDREFYKRIESEYKEFCKIQNEKYPGANIILKAGVYILKVEDIGGDGFDKAVLAKRRIKNPTESFTELY